MDILSIIRRRHKIWMIVLVLRRAQKPLCSKRGNGSITHHLRRKRDRSSFLQSENHSWEDKVIVTAPGEECKLLEQRMFVFSSRRFVTSHNAHKNKTCPVIYLLTHRSAAQSRQPFQVFLWAFILRYSWRMMAEESFAIDGKDQFSTDVSQTGWNSR